MVNLAIVGFSGYGWLLVKNINELAEEGHCRLVAASRRRLNDNDEQVVELKARGVELFDDAIAMLDAMKGKCDAVYIATSIGSHEYFTTEAAKRGYHVHLEKPPAATVQEVDHMQEALEAAGRLCIVGFQGMYAENIIFLKQRIVEGRLGAVRSLTCCACSPRKASYYNRNDWPGKLRMGDKWTLDGPAMNAISHQIMSMLCLASPEANHSAVPTAVRAEMYAAGPVESHDTAAIEIQTAEGPSVYFLASHCTDGAHEIGIEIEAEKAKVTWDRKQGVTITYADGTEESCGKGEISPLKAMVSSFSSNFHGTASESSAASSVPSSSACTSSRTLGQLLFS